MWRFLPFCVVVLVVHCGRHAKKTVYGVENQPDLYDAPVAPPPYAPPYTGLAPHAAPYAEPAPYAAPYAEPASYAAPHPAPASYAAPLAPVLVPSHRYYSQSHSSSSHHNKKKHHKKSHNKRSHSSSSSHHKKQHKKVCPRNLKLGTMSDLSATGVVTANQPQIQYHQDKWGNCWAYIRCLGNANDAIHVVGTAKDALSVVDYMQSDGSILECNARMRAHTVLQYNSKERKWQGFDLNEHKDKDVKVIGCVQYSDYYTTTNAAGQP